MSDTPRTDAEVVSGWVNSDDHRVVDETDYWAMTEHARRLERELHTMTLEHANALGTAAAEAAARKRNLARAQELERQLAQSEALYAQVTLGSRELQAKYRLLVDAHAKLRGNERGRRREKAKRHGS